MEVGSRQEVDRQVRRPVWRQKEVGPLPAREELADRLRPKERRGESRHPLDSKGRGELPCLALVKTLWGSLGCGFDGLDSTYPYALKKTLGCEEMIM